MKLYATDRFRDKAARFRDPIRVRTKLQRMLSWASEDPNWTRHFERIHTHIPDVYREKVSKGDRLLFQFQGDLTLLDIDTHDIYDDWARNLSKSSAKAMVSNAKPLELDDWRIFPTSKRLSVLKPNPNPSFANDSILAVEEAEWDERWLLYLSEDQMEVLLRLEADTKTKSDAVRWVWGGAGTGKTVVALHLVQRLMAQGECVSFETLPRARNFLESGYKSLASVHSNPSRGCIHIIDDPLNYDQALHSIRQAQAAGAKAIIVFIDPLQASGRAQTAAFAEVNTRGYKDSLYVLRSCYRQAEKLGLEIRALTAEAYGYSDYGDKAGLVRLENNIIEMLSLEVSFAKPGGIFEVISGDFRAVLGSVCDRLRDRYELWSWTSPLLVVWSEKTYSSRKDARHLLQGIQRQDLRLKDSELARGVEYQELILVISKTEYEELVTIQLPVTPFSWHALAPLYTFLSRAKDAVTIIVDETL